MHLAPPIDFPSPHTVDDGARNDSSPFIGIPLTPAVRARGFELFHQGDDSERFICIRCGWVGLHQILEDGRRQIVGFGLAGELVGLTMWPDSERDYGITALTDVAFAQGRNAHVAEIAARNPHATIELCMALQALDHEVLQNLVMMACRTAEERVAHLLTTLSLRLLYRPPHRDERIPVPLTQQTIGEATGLSYVHVNRVLRTLREKRIVILRDGVLTVRDPHALLRTAHIEPDVYIAKAVRHRPRIWMGALTGDNAPAPTSKASWARR